MVPNIEKDYILLMVDSVLYKEYKLTGFNHQRNLTTKETLLISGVAFRSGKHCHSHLH